MTQSQNDDFSVVLESLDDAINMWPSSLLSDQLKKLKELDRVVTEFVDNEPIEEEEDPD